MNYAKDRVGEVSQVLGERLLNIQRYEAAAELFEAVNYFEKAVEAYMAIGKFDRALDVAQNVRPHEMKEMLVSRINQMKKDKYIAGGKIGKIVESGDMSGLEMLASRG
jgi:tetratricopeptide (TPR) repeat protein